MCFNKNNSLYSHVNVKLNNMTDNLLLTSDYQGDTDAEHLNSFGEDENLLNLQRFNFQELYLYSIQFKRD